MPPTQAITNVFKQDMLKGVHNFTTTTGSSFKMALVTNASTDGAGTANLAAISNQVTGTGYTAGGNVLVIPASMPGLTSTTAFADFDDVTWGTSTITARGALIYNDTASGDPSVCVLDFGSDKVSSAGNFTVQFPAGDSTNAIIRIL
jgi:hypothetical protein